MFTILLYILWALSLAGLIAITLNRFQYPDLNIVVGILVFFAMFNTFLAAKKK